MQYVLRRHRSMLEHEYQRRHNDQSATDTEQAGEKAGNGPHGQKCR